MFILNTMWFSLRLYFKKGIKKLKGNLTILKEPIHPPAGLAKNNKLAG